MPTLFLHTDFGDKYHLAVTEIGVEQYLVPKFVKASQLAAAVRDRGGELHIDYEGYKADEEYDAAELKSRDQALDDFIAGAIEWFRTRGSAIERDDLPGIF